MLRRPWPTGESRKTRNLLVGRLMTGLPLFARIVYYLQSTQEVAPKNPPFYIVISNSYMCMPCNEIIICQIDQNIYATLTLCPYLNSNAAPADCTDVLRI